MLTRLTVLLFLAPGLLLLTVAGVEAQDKWSFVFTPQVWFENVRNNGFAASNNASGLSSNTFLQVVPSTALDSTGADPTSYFFPQWGGQFAAQRGPWTFGVAAQYLSFETSNTFTTTSATFPCSPGNPFCTPGSQIAFTPPFRGDKLYTEIINTDRTDVDVTATYFFPDVIKDLLDVTTGLGFKWIRASGHRTLSNVNTGILGANPTFTFSAFPAQYFRKSCGNLNSYLSTFNRTFNAPDDCLTNRASFLDQYYGATIPTTLNFHLTPDGKWLLPLTMTPFLGSEGSSDQVLGWQTSFAYGGTFDVGVRYV
ncbi:MAG TPA: hypothetical protein VGV06_02700, partial [Methylomirabilota bacterium]|nr:hypothetical protein [Methylomirabilota bacterium]